MTVSQKKWGAIVRQRLWWLHWLMAACFLIIFTVGIYMADLPRGALYRQSLFAVHKSFGVLVFGLVWLRIALLLRKQQIQPTRLPQKWSQRVRTVVLHTILYGFMLVVPLSGYAFSSMAGADIPLFGLELPRLLAENEARVDTTRAIHFWLAYLFLVGISLHIIVQRRFLKTLWQRIIRTTR